jgi:hypothetical protein
MGRRFSGRMSPIIAGRSLSQCLVVAEPKLLSRGSPVRIRAGVFAENLRRDGDFPGEFSARISISALKHGRKTRRLRWSITVGGDAAATLGIPLTTHSLTFWRNDSFVPKLVPSGVCHSQNEAALSRRHNETLGHTVSNFECYCVFSG